MKQFQLEQVKFPKLSTNALQQPIISQSKRNKSKVQSEMLRIIIALLIAIFIFNSSQETTINYNEIIKNQKMFLVKNIRGVLPTLSGSLKQLQRSWKVVHFQNYHSNQSEIFNNYTFTFNKLFLTAENSYCKFNVSYEWKNYSYNIDFKQILQTTIEPKKTKQQIISSTEKQIDQKNSNQKTVIFDKNQTNNSQKFKNQTQVLRQVNSTIPLNSKNEISTPSKKVQNYSAKQKQKICEINQNYFKEVFKYASIWTISDQNLYLLLQNTHLEEDFYMILQPLKI